MNSSFILSLALDQFAQSLAIAVFLKLALFASRDWPAAFRYRLTMVAMAISVLMPSCAFLPAWHHLASYAPVALRSPEIHAAISRTTPLARHFSISDFLLALWAVGVVVSGVRIVLELRRLGQIARTAAIRSRFAEVAVATHRAVPGPMVVGYTRQLILLPPDLADRLSSDTLTGLLAHEYAHVIRRDTWAALAQRLLTTLLWWNLMIHWMNRRLNAEREKACDSIAAAKCGGTAQFARALVDYARLALDCGPSPLALSVAADKSQLSRRVHSLLKRPGVVTRPILAAVCSLSILPLAGIAIATPRITVATANSLPFANAPQNSGFDPDTGYLIAAQAALGADSPALVGPGNPQSRSSTLRLTDDGKQSKAEKQMPTRRQHDVTDHEYRQYDQITDQYRRYNAYQQYRQYYPNTDLYRKYDTTY